MSRCVRSILASLALLAALGVVLGIGLAVVYADHIYSPYEGLTKLQVIDPAHDASGGFDARFDELVDPDAAPRAAPGGRPLGQDKPRHAPAPKRPGLQRVRRIRPA